MFTVKEASQLFELPNGNRFIGKATMTNSTIVFSGENNILYCDGEVNFDKSYLHFGGSNSVIYLSTTPKPYKISVSIYNDSALYIGKNNFINVYHPNTFAISEQKHVFIGNNCLLSFDISFKTADPHLVYDAVSRTRINNSKSIYIGDHVWLGQEIMLLKGTKIHSGCIIGTRALLSNKELPHQTSWGGNPAKKLRDSVYWKGDSVHYWREEETAKSACLEENEISILSHDPNAYISFDEIDERLTAAKNADEKCAVLKEITANDSPVRFVEAPQCVPIKKKRLLERIFKK